MPVTMPTYDLVTLTPMLRSFIDLNDVRARALLTAPVRYMQQVYILGLQDLNTGTAAVTLAGSRYLALLNGLAVAADVTQPTASAAAKIAGISSGPQINQSIDAILRVQRLPDVQNAAYELTTLRIPGVLTESYWVQLINGADHLYVPFLSLNKQLQLGTAYNWADYLQRIQGVAQKNLAFYATDMANVP